MSQCSKLVRILLGLSLSSTQVGAETPAEPSVGRAPARAAEVLNLRPEPPEDASSNLKTTFSTSFDFYYAWNVNTPPSTVVPSKEDPGLPEAAHPLRYPDIYNNEFALSLAELTVKTQGQETGLLIDFDFGQMPAYLNRYHVGDVTETADHVGQNIGQAIVAYSPKDIPGLTVSAGKMISPLGYESTKASENWNYSMSLLAAIGTPNWHSGLSAAYALIPDRLTVTGYVYNGWDTLYDNNTGKSYAAQVFYRPSATTTCSYVGIVGPEQDSNDRDLSQIQELTATWTPSPRLSFMADAIYGSTERTRLGLPKATWDSILAQAKFQLTPRYALTPRLEYYGDHQGFTTLEDRAQDLWAVTLTQSIRLPERLETRFEIKHDQSSGRTFLNKHGDHQLISQTTATLAVLFGF